MRRMHRQQPSLVDLDARLGDIGADGPLLGKRLPECDAPLHAGAHQLERALGA